MNAMRRIVLAVWLLAGCGQNKIDDGLREEVSQLRLHLQEEKVRARMAEMDNENLATAWRDEVRQWRSKLETESAKAHQAEEANRQMVTSNESGKKAALLLEKAAQEQSASLALLDEAFGNWEKVKLDLEAAKANHDEKASEKWQAKLKDEQEFCLGYLNSLELALDKTWKELKKQGDAVYGVDGGKKEKEAIQLFHDSFEESKKRLVGFRASLAFLFAP